MWLLVLLEGRETLVEAIITKSIKKLRLGEKGEMARIEVEHNSTQRSKSDWLPDCLTELREKSSVQV